MSNMKKGCVNEKVHMPCLTRSCDKDIECWKPFVCPSIETWCADSLSGFSHMCVSLSKILV